MADNGNCYDNSAKKGQKGNLHGESVLIRLIFAEMKEEVQYETVVGLEVHAQLLTKSKLFCGDSTEFGAAPNNNVSPISLGHPGTLPKMNKQAIEYAIKLGIAFNCNIEQQNYFARKNYFYPDLPKGYQVSQHTTPICRNGWIDINTSGNSKRIRLNRIHLEEDAGKSIHDIDEQASCLDYNRAGTALVEIVTEPDLSNGEEAYTYLTLVRKMVRTLGVCDGNMEEGSLRCDANVSVRKKGDPELGVKTEIKNLNSIRNVKRAIEEESKRLIRMLETGQQPVQETRSFNAEDGSSFPIRLKEDADDYRYFPEPDLTPFHIEDSLIQSIRAAMPELNQSRKDRFISSYHLSEYDASLLSEDGAFAGYYEQVLQCLSESGKNRMAKPVANWMLGPVKSWLNNEDREIEQFPIKPSKLAELVLLVEESRCSFSAASGRIMDELLKNPDFVAIEIAERLDLVIQSDTDGTLELIEKVLLKYPDKVTEFRKGKKGLLALFVGEVMKSSKGKADPKLVNELLINKLSNK